MKSSALVNIVDGDFLKSIYFNADSDDLKDVIISKTDDVDICTDYVFTGSDSKLIRKACERITYENVLKDLFFKVSGEWLCKVLSKNIHDGDFFLEILYGDYDKDLKSVALGAIENKENLVNVTNDFTALNLSKYAINLIKDYSALRSICEMIPTCESDKKIIEYARENLYELFFKSEVQVYMYGG